MNWYILFSLTQKSEKLVKQLNTKKDIYAFIPQMEYYRRDIKDNALKPLFPGYVFVKSKLNQNDFDLLLMNMNEEKDGLIKQLKYRDTNALREDEIVLLKKLLDDQYILRMSQANLDNHKKAVIYTGPLRHFEKNIIKVDKHNKMAYLDIKFLDRYIQAGLSIKAKYEI